MVSRFAGLNAQALEERERMKPMRVIEPRAWFYDGPSLDHEAKDESRQRSRLLLGT